MAVTVREGTLDDLTAAVAIYGVQAESGIATFETRAPDPATWRDKVEGPHPFLVAEVDEVDGAEGRVVAGFAFASQFRPRPAYHLSLETSIYLDPAHVGQGIGRRLYTDLLDRLRAAGAHTALAVVALPNDASLALHERLGFEPVGTLREVGHKFDRLIDVALLQLIL